LLKFATVANVDVVVGKFKVAEPFIIEPDVIVKLPVFIVKPLAFIVNIFEYAVFALVVDS
jgi:hypothetical protein